jgi:hypothetical protein
VLLKQRLNQPPEEAEGEVPLDRHHTATGHLLQSRDNSPCYAKDFAAGDRQFIGGRRKRTSKQGCNVPNLAAAPSARPTVILSRESAEDAGKFPFSLGEVFFHENDD